MSRLEDLQHVFDFLSFDAVGAQKRSWNILKRGGSFQGRRRERGLQQYFGDDWAYAAGEN